MVRAVASRVIPRQRISKAVAQEAAAEVSRLTELVSSAHVPSTTMNIPTRASTNKHTVHALADDYSGRSNSVHRHHDDERHRIPDLQQARAVIRPMGTSRRMFLLDSNLSAEDMEGLAYRIRALSRNDGIASLLIATDDQDDLELNCLPRYITNRRDVKRMFDGISIDVKPPPSPFGPTKDRTWYVSGGYDAFDVAEKLRNLESEQEKGEYAHYLLESLQKLAVAVQGGSMTTTTGTLALSDASSSSSSNSTDDDKTSKIPVITVPHGAVTDGGFALCMGSYVLATPETSFKIMNPSRGLSLDPIGLSFILPRLGWEHSQLSSKYSQGCGFILALAGFEADSFDMVQTGLATHLVADSVSGALPILEEELAMMEPWNQQGLVKPYKRFYGEDTDASTNSNSTNNNMLLGGGRRFDSYRGGDANRDFRNKRIAYLMDQVSDHAADMKSGGAFPYDFAAIYEGSDASLDTDDVPWDTGFFSSPLVDIAAHLDRSVFQKQKSLEELINLLQQEGAKADERLANYNGGGETAADGADHVDGFIDGINVAKDLADRMTRQSPLALRVVYHLLEKGCRNLATIEKCMEAELRAQHAMMSRQDFTNWSEHVRKHGGDEQSAPPFTGWQHRSVKDVTADEVKEIVGE